MTEPDVTETDESADTDGRVGEETGADPDLNHETETDGRVEDDTDAAAGSTDTEHEPGPEGVDVEALSERVAAASNEQIAREIATLRSLVADLEARETESERIDELESKLARKQADFENFKKRMNKRRTEERERATEDLVTRLLGVRDDLVRALSQDSDADIRGGVESTLTEFDRVLDDEGVGEISPEPGTEIDPQYHEVMMRVDSEHPEGTVAEVFRSGYEMGEKVLRPAQVTVSEGDAGDTDDE